MSEAVHSPDATAIATTSHGKLRPDNVVAKSADVEEYEREMRASHLREENMQLKSRLSQLQDQLEDHKRQLHAERSARQGLDAELAEVRERLRLARDHVDQQKREHNEVALRLCAVTAERDELETKVGEVWHNMAAVEEAAQAKEAANRALREGIESERRERAAQDVLMSAMVAQIAALEHQVVAGEGAEERHRRLSEDTLRTVKAEVQRMARIIESLADTYLNAPLDRDADQKLSLLLTNGGTNDNDDNDDGDGDNNDNNGGSTAGNGLNTSYTEGVIQNEPLLKSDAYLLDPMYQALRHLRQQLQRQYEERCAMQRARHVLEAHIAALKDGLQQLGNDGDDMRERLLKSEAQRAQVVETLEGARQLRQQEEVQLAEVRCKIALLLDCVDDWYVIEQRISDLVKEVQRLRSDVEEGHRMHKVYVSEKEKEIDAMVDSHQREVSIQRQQLEQARQESERFKRAAAAASANASIVTTESGISGGLPMEMQREHDSLKVKYRELLRYMEDELEPLMSEQGKALQEEKVQVDELRRANDALQLEMKLLSSSHRHSEGQLSLFEALVLSLRVLSGTMTDMQEMSQQRRALTRYILLYERMFGTLSVCGEPMGPRPLLRFRRTVVAVLAAQRLLALGKSSRHRRECIIPPDVRGGVRIRLPQETCSLVVRGLIHLPPVRNGFEDLVGKEDDEEEEGEKIVVKGGEKDGVAFVTERDLQLPVMNRKAFGPVMDEVAAQSRSLRSFMDSLLSFVTVPSAMRFRRDGREPLWWRLATGLRALRRLPSRQRGEGLYTSTGPHSLLHLPPRVPERPHIALQWGESPMVGAAPTTTAAQRSPSPASNSENLNTFVRQTARGLSSSLKRVQKTGTPSATTTTAYPAPQPLDSHTEDASNLEETLRQSLLRDSQLSSDPQEMHLGSGFASEVLNVIRALDQRLVGALERHQHR